LLVYAATLVYGSVLASGKRELEVAAGLAVGSAIALWCSVDARVHGKLFLRSFEWLMVFTWPVGALAHLVWTRGRRGFVTYVLAFFCFLLALGLGALVEILLLEWTT
jgi:hypothetical protein